MFFPFDAFMAILVTMGPLKVMLVYAQLTRDLDKGLRRRIAVKAVSIALIIGLVFIVLGKVLLDLFHFSIGALMIAGGAILFVVGISMVLAKGEEADTEPDRDPTKVSTYPLAIPMMATPVGLVVLTVLSARYSNDTTVLISLAVMLTIVMIINLLVLLFESGILKLISPDIINVAERILGLLLAALAVQTILNGLVELGLITLKTVGHWYSDSVNWLVNREAEAITIYHLTIPLMASQMGLETLTIVSTNRGVETEDLIFLSILLLVIITINLISLLSVDFISKYLSAEKLEVTNRILAVLLATLAMKTLINGFADLLRGAVEQLQEMGSIQKWIISE